MIKKVMFFKILLFLLSFHYQANSDDFFEYRLSPEVNSKIKLNEIKKKIGHNYVITSANPYATAAAEKILLSGGNAADAAVALQITLGLVEPQSSGLGGGSFALFYNNLNKEITNYDGRETAPKKINSELFLDEKKTPMRFFDAVLGGKSVGVPGTLETLFQIQQDHGLLDWSDLFKSVIDLSYSGFLPPPRLIKSLNKEKFLWEELTNIDIFKKILKFPEKLVKNIDYAKTLEKISKNHRVFYDGDISNEIVRNVREAKKNPGKLSVSDLKSYKVKKSKALCTELKKFILCGPNLPSSGGILITQGLLIYEKLTEEKKKDFFEVLNIINFLYQQRAELADPDFVKINIKEILDPLIVEKKYKIFLKKQGVASSKIKFHSTSHFSILDKEGNVISMTSSIENSFGSRIFTDGFFLNNQLTDFSFNPYKDSKLHKNRPEGGKKPLSSMTPIIILDKNKDFLFTSGSPGGTAIISYVFKTIIDIFYLGLDPMESLNKGNYLKKGNKLYLEKGKFNLEKIVKSKKDNEEIIERPLSSGITVIKKENNYLHGYADPRRDGNVQAK